MKINNKSLGIAGIIAAPFLGLELSVNGTEQNTSLGGFFDLVYMLGWMCSILALLKMKATGEKTTGRVVLYIQLALLCIANALNIWVIIDPANSSALFFVLDFFWPLSNLFMLATGVAVAAGGRLNGWRRWTGLLAGLWLPFSIVIMMLDLNNTKAMNISITYSVVAWSLLGLSIATSDDPVKTGMEAGKKIRAVHQSGRSIRRPSPEIILPD